MATPSDFLDGALERCPALFNAAEYCLTPAVDPACEALVIIHPDGSSNSWSFGKLRARVLAGAGALEARGLRSGDRVMLQLGDSPDFPFAYFSAMAAGAVPVPLAASLTKPEIEKLTAIICPKLVLTDANALKGGPAVAFAKTRADDPAFLVFTSGSSGTPKGVLHAHRSFWARQSMRAGWHDMRPGDRVLHAGAFNWTFTLGVGLADAWSAGATALIYAGERRPELWPDIVRAHQPTIFAGAPGVFRRVLKYGRDLKESFASLRHAVTAGEALDASVAQDWNVQTGKPLLEALGMSEVSTFISAPPGRTPPKGHVGWAQAGRRIAVLEGDGIAPKGTTGELAVRRDDPGLMLGYINAAGSVERHQGDWFRTGDLVRMGEDGAIAYLGRMDDRMNAQGYRVDPLEVEGVIKSCPGVADCGVTALTIEAGLSVIGAWILPDGGAISRADIDAFLAEQLAAHKRPKALFLVESLPQTATGKLKRKALPDWPSKPL